MLLAAKEFKSLKLRAEDGDIGKAREFLFDDHFWNVRYLVADTNNWLTGRLVLISPYALKAANLSQNVLPVKLTKKQIEESPSLASDEPVSRQFENQYYGYYGWPYYGFGPYSWGYSPYLSRDEAEWNTGAQRQEAWDPRLRSTNDVIGHHIQAVDGEVGHVEDFIVDEENWSIRYLVVATKNWGNGKHILVSPQWIKRISWEQSLVFVTQTVEALKNSPQYSAETLNRDYESKLYRHYDWRGYWVDEKVPATVGR
jgi:hypothetical protein